MKPGPSEYHPTPSTSALRVLATSYLPSHREMYVSSQEGLSENQASKCSVFGPQETYEPSDESTTSRYYSIFRCAIYLLTYLLFTSLPAFIFSGSAPCSLTRLEMADNTSPTLPRPHALCPSHRRQSAHTFTQCPVVDSRMLYNGSSICFFAVFLLFRFDSNKSHD